MNQFLNLNLNITLSPDQHRAIQHPGHLTLTGGAGTGKTLVSVLRAGQLLAQHPNAGHLYIAFSRSLVDKAYRLFAQHLSADQLRRLTVCNRHTLCARIVREHGDRIGFRTDKQRCEPQVIQAEALDAVYVQVRDAAHALLQSRDPEAALLLMGADLEMLKGCIRDEKRAGRMPLAMATITPLQRAYAAVYAALQDELCKLNRITFDDMLLLAAHILRQYSEVRAFYQSLFGAGITIDECQDSTPLAWEIDCLLVRPDAPFTLVGDAHQTIFGYLGALGNAVFEWFSQSHPDAMQVHLHCNQRSAAPIVELANLYTPLDQRQEAACEGGVPITFRQCADPQDEARWVGSEIQLAVQCRATSYDQIAVLARTRDQLDVFAGEFVRQSIPCYRVGKGTFWDQPDIRFLLAGLSLSQDPDDHYWFKVIVGHPLCGLAANIKAWLKGDEAELCWYHLSNEDALAKLTADARDSVQRLCTLLEALQYAKDIAPAQMITFLMGEVGLTCACCHTTHAARAIPTSR